MLIASCSDPQTNIQVGRIETTVALLRNLERLVTPHIPRDTVVDVDRSVRQAVRVGKQIQKRMRHEGSLALMRPRQDRELPTMPSADQQELKVRSLDDECIDSGSCAPMCSAGKPYGGQEVLRIVSRTPSPIAPFCVDITLQTLRSFLDLIKGIRQVMSLEPASPARNPVGVDKTDASGAPDGKRAACQAQVATDAIGPECCEGSPAKADPLGNIPSKQQHAAPTANVDEFAVASRSDKLEVLRGTLKLLKVNLFHLVRVAAMRRACRENCDIKLSSKDEGNPVCNEGHEGSRRETNGTDDERFAEGVVGGSDGLQSRASRPEDGENAGDGNKTTSSVAQEAVFENKGQKGCSGVGEREEDMPGVIRELHAVLRTILEETTDDKDAETTNAALAVQVRNVSVGACPQNVLTPLST